MTAFLGNETGEGVDATIVTGLIAMLDETSAMAKAFRMARNWCHAHNLVNFELHLLSEWKTSAHQYNIVSEVVALITNDFGDGIATRDIVVDSKDGGPKRILELHPSYMALQYPLLFPYGEQDSMKRSPIITMQDHEKQNMNYQDAMALCRAYGNPDLFITFTSNLKWPKITKMLALIPGQKPHDRPDVGTRIFKMKLTELLDDLTKREIFGKSRAEEWKCRTPTQIDDIMSAEIPCLTDDPEGYKVVTEFMLQCPYGKGDACGKCSKRFPKPFYTETIINDDGYPVYRRRDLKVFAVKGPDRATIVIQENVQKAMWRLFSFDIHYSYPSVMKLNFHLEDQNVITLRDSQNLPALLEREDIKLTMFTEWFELNKRDTTARKLTYAEIPKPLQLWEQSWKILSEDILHKKRKLFKYPDLQLTDEQLKNYCLLEIEALLNRNSRYLTDFPDLPRPDPTLLTHIDNRLIREALDYDIKKSKLEHAQLHSLLNPEHRVIYE
ncbi:ATP-dependent DNA helicase PIF1-like protein [Tanacetum coccineum]